MNGFIEKIDHPILFVLFVSMCVFAIGGIGKWAADKTGLVGLKSALPQ